MDGVVLVLNQNYEPLNVCNLPRAFRLLFGERAEVIEYKAIAQIEAFSSSISTRQEVSEEKLSNATKRST